MRNEQYDTDEKLDTLLKEELTRHKIPERLSPDAMTAKLRTESRPKIINHRKGKKALIAAGAAAAVLAGTTLSVGAAVDWDYRTLFNKYFSDSTDTPVGFDFTGMGMDIDHRLDCEGYTVYVKSILADGYSVMVLYDTILDDEIFAEHTVYDIDTALYVDVMYGQDNLKFSGTVDTTKLSDGVFQSLLHIVPIQFQEVLDPKDITLTFTPKTIDVDVENGNVITLNSIADSFSISLAEVSFDSAKAAPDVHYLPYYGANEATTISLSPLSLTVNFDAITHPEEITDGLNDNDEKYDSEMPTTEDWTIKAIRNDGTELTLKQRNHTLYYDGISQPNKLQIYIPFETPLRTDDIVAIMIDDVRIPLA